MTRTTGTVYECEACGLRAWSESLPAGWWERDDGEAHLCERCEFGWQMAQKAKAVARGE